MNFELLLSVSHTSICTRLGPKKEDRVWESQQPEVKKGQRETGDEKVGRNRVEGVEGMECLTNVALNKNGERPRKILIANKGRGLRVKKKC